MMDDPPEKKIVFAEHQEKHLKASERYIPVKFKYADADWEGWVPIEYRRSGLNIKTDEEVLAYLNHVYQMMSPENIPAWRERQKQYWQTNAAKATTTKAFFEVLAENNQFTWKCVECRLPANPNWARRIQDLKDRGYTLATDTKRYCHLCKANKTHVMLLPLPRGEEVAKYETISPKLRKRIIRLFESVDVFEGSKKSHCLPDHKFPEIRWDGNVHSENPDSMPEDEIRQKFQLLSNQRNLQKREVCRNCFQTGRRGSVIGLPIFYDGGPLWDEKFPKRGLEAEQGCVGCPWYDMARWRSFVNGLYAAHIESHLHKTES
ncbi:MAG: restriction endonuclease [Lentisphaeria bacterium]|jgi:hypothetical protein|nr:restriction endonuclease [Lentisphaeria bacterium]MDY0176490.1 restriction endonuclease [Lentisphaeria bacterium]